VASGRKTLPTGGIEALFFLVYTVLRALAVPQEGEEGYDECVRAAAMLLAHAHPCG
jgi:hypothetical protein